jgi:hypothetical protein
LQSRFAAARPGAAENRQMTESPEKKRKLAKLEAFDATFERLKRVLKKYERHLTIISDTPEGYSLNAAYSDKWQKEIFFGGVQIKKTYVSFYLMPLYMYPELLSGLSKKLKARMQGKSCFNFRTADQDQLNELDELTSRGFERFREEGLV